MKPSGFYVDPFFGLEWRIDRKIKKRVCQNDTPSFKWCHQESNRGHKDFQSFALPTELWHHRFAVAKIE